MIEVGEYVRTHKGDIHKVIGIREELKKGKRIYSHKAYYLDSKKGSLTEAFIVKHSKSIIDLIEVGDYVNGYYIYEIREVGEWKWLEIEADLLSNRIEENEIKSIVTKEQMEAIQYVVK